MERGYISCHTPLKEIFSHSGNQAEKYKDITLPLYFRQSTYKHHEIDEAITFWFYTDCLGCVSLNVCSIDGKLSLRLMFNKLRGFVTILCCVACPPEFQIVHFKASFAFSFCFGMSQLFKSSPVK